MVAIDRAQFHVGYLRPWNGMPLVAYSKYACDSGAFTSWTIRAGRAWVALVMIW